MLALTAAALGSLEPMSGSRNGAIARAEKYFDDGGFLSRPAAARRHPHHQPGAGLDARAAAVRLGRDDRVAAEAGLRLHRPAQSAAGIWSVPDRPPGRGRDEADRADLRPWRRDPRPGGPVAAGPVAVEYRDRRRAHVWPRHRRQQGPAHHQHRGARLRARGARRARLQLDHPDRDRRGDRLAGPGRLLQGQQGGAQGRRADRLGRPAARPSPARPSSAARAAR